MSRVKQFDFVSPTELVFGNGVSNDLGKHLKQLGVKKVLVVTDKVIMSVGIFDQMIPSLKDNNIEWAVYDQVQPEPPVENCYEALDLYKSEGCNGVLGLGGGSAIDVAKATAMMVTNPGKYEDYVGIGKVPNKCDSLVLMPTTSGTGSEVSIFSIMIVNGSKMGVVDSNITANIALVDPLLTLSVPRKVTAATGLDALCHHIESFISTNDSPMTDMICLEGIRVISSNLRQAYGNLRDEEARYWMSYGSTLGGFVMNLTSGAAANHGLAFALGAKFHVGHGLSNAVMLPYVFPVVAKAEPEKTGRIAQALGLNCQGIQGRELIEKVTKALYELVDDCGCAIPLTSFGVKDEDIEMLTEEVVKTQGRVMGHSTYQLDPAEIAQIFKNAM